jgi:branched-chain amino acid transport system permease protein
MIFEIVLNGLMLGGLYTLMGTGFSLQWGISGIINLAYGGMMVLGAYIAFVFFSVFSIQPVISAIPAGILMFVIGLLIYQFLLRPTIKRGSFFATLIMTFAVELVLENLMLLIWASDYRIISSPYSSLGMEVFHTHLPFVKAFIFGLSFVAVILVHLFMSKTKPGKAIQASALNPDGARFIGIDVERMYAINFALGAGIGAVAGALASNINAFSVVLTGGLLGKVFVIAVLGGLGNIWGAALGGITLGLVEALGTLTVGPAYNEALGLIVMVVVLVLRPRGLIGRKFWDV